MKKKIVIGVLLFCLLIITIALLTACKNDAGLQTQSGKDQYGREYGAKCDIDEYPSGIYSIEYSIEDTSAMGKSMIGSYCYDKVKLNVANEKYVLTFYCKNDSFSDVKLNGELGESVEESGMYGYKFEIARLDFDSKLAMTGKVALMNKEVSFSIKPDISTSVLIGTNAINSDDIASGNN